MRDPLRLSITVHSEGMTPEEMTEVIGLQPTRSRAKGSPISSRGHAGPKSEVSWHYQAATETDWDINGLAEELRPAMERLAALRGQFDSAEMWLMAHGRPMGAWITLAPEYIQLMAKAGLELHLDMYCSDECCQDEDESENSHA